MNSLVIHLMTNPVSALRFVDPLVCALRSQGLNAELWTEHWPGLESFIAAIRSPKRRARFDLVANPLRVLANLVITWRAFREVRPIGIHAHQTRGSLLPLLAARLAGVPIRIYHNHGSAYWGTSGLLKAAFKILEKCNCGLATHVLLVNPALRQAFVNDGIVEPAKAMVPGPGSACGIDLAAYPCASYDSEEQRKCRREMGIAENEFVALYVGRRYKRKGFDFLLKAWSGSSMARSGNTLLVVGAARDDVWRVVGRERAGNIRALGYCRDIADLYAACDVVVLPSEHEGLPYALLEASACGRALVASDIPGVRMLVRDRIEGLLHPVRNKDVFVACLELLKADPQFKAQLGANARAIAKAFDQKVVLKSLIDFYHALAMPGIPGLRVHDHPRGRTPLEQAQIQPNIGDAGGHSQAEEHEAVTPK